MSDCQLDYYNKGIVNRLMNQTELWELSVAITLGKTKFVVWL